MGTLLRTLTLAAATGLTSLVAIGCSGSGQVAQDLTTSDGQFIEIYKPEPVGREAAFAGESSGDVRPLMTPGAVQIGTATAWNDLDNYYVKLETDAAQIFVALEISPSPAFIGIPFLYDLQDLPGGGTEYTFTVSRDGFPCGTEFFASAFALTFDGSNLDMAFAEGTDAYDLIFMGKGYPETLTPFCVLPPGSITLTPAYPNGTTSYWGHTFTGFGAGYDIADGANNTGWCVDLAHYLAPGVPVPVTLYSSYDHSLPSYAASANWDMINYVLNHKSFNHYLDVQHAIWFFKGTGAFPSDPEAAAMVSDALANGEGYEPGAGDVVAVVVDAGSARQLTIIEVNCSCESGESFDGSIWAPFLHQPNEVDFNAQYDPGKWDEEEVPYPVLQYFGLRGQNDMGGPGM